MQNQTVRPRIATETLDRLADVVENLKDAVEDLTNAVAPQMVGDVDIPTKDAVLVPIVHLQRLAVDIAQVRNQRGNLRNEILTASEQHPNDVVLQHLAGVVNGDLRRNYLDFHLSVLDKFADPEYFV
jgi:hypothetical protein